MGLLDDAASMVSGRSSTSKHDKHHKHREYRTRSRSRSSSRSRHHPNRSSSHLPGIAASIFGGEDKHHKHTSSRASFFGLGSHGNASRGSFFGFGSLLFPPTLPPLLTFSLSGL